MGLTGEQVSSIVKGADGHSHYSLREAFRAIRDAIAYDSGRDAFNEALKALISPLPGVATPAEYVKAAGKIKVKCRRCAGTGQFITYVENGVPKGPGGPCFRCEGKGFQTWRDGFRNRAYDLHAMAQAFQADMRSY